MPQEFIDAAEAVVNDPRQLLLLQIRDLMAADKWDQVEKLQAQLKALPVDDGAEEYDAHEDEDDYESEPGCCENSLLALQDVGHEVLMSLLARFVMVLRLFKYCLLIVPPASVTGLACSSLLYILSIAISFRDGKCVEKENPLYACEEIDGSHRWLIFLLPLGGVIVAQVFELIDVPKGRARAVNRESAKVPLQTGGGGSATLFAGIEGAAIPLRMTPLVWFGTAVTHFFGGSAGREGTGIQMAASITSKWLQMLHGTIQWACPTTHWNPFKDPGFAKACMLSSVGAGFAGIFGTPLTGGMFALELMTVGQVQYEAMFPALFASIIADYTCRSANHMVWKKDLHSQYFCIQCAGHKWPQTAQTTMPHPFWSWSKAETPFGPKTEEELRAYTGYQGLAPQPFQRNGDPGAFVYWPNNASVPTSAIGVWEQLNLKNPQSFGTWGQHSPVTLLKIVAAGIFFGLCGTLFAQAIEVFKDFYGWLIPGDRFKLGGKSRAYLLKPFVGGAVVVALWILFSLRQNPFDLPAKYNGMQLGGTAANGLPGYKFGDSYTGLGTGTPGDSISKSFQPDGINFLTFLWKTLFTTLTLAAGYKGGEVTPLFFIGAAAGNSAAWVLGEDPQLFAGLGLCAVFAAATNTPMACTLMGFELFGGMMPLYFGEACFIAYMFSGNTGIYVKQFVAKASKSIAGDFYNEGNVSAGDGVRLDNAATRLEALAKQEEEGANYQPPDPAAARP